MKKMILAFAALFCLLAAPTANAQYGNLPYGGGYYTPSINEELPNEISASYGFSLIGATASKLIDIFGLVDALTDGDYIAVKSGGSRGIINASYLYHTNRIFAVGGSVGFNRMSVNMEDKTGKITAASANIISAMVNAKVNWFRYDIFGMYSKFGLGVMCINGNLMEEAGGNVWLPTAHISAIGMELGRQFCGFVELGAGMQGIAQVGLKLHF